MKTVPILLLLILAGCNGRAPSGPVVISMIGGDIHLVDPARVDPDPAGAALLGAVAQGLVGFDAQAQIVPGLAIRWAISDDGLYYTFRLDGSGPDAKRADADQVARALRRVIRRARSGVLANRLDRIGEIVAVTPEVIEIRLSAPCPGLMTLLAAPEFAILIDGKGTGPLTIDGRIGPLTRLRGPAGDHETDPPATDRPVLLRGERVAKAVARFAQGQASAVSGGDFTDIAYPGLAGLGAPALHVDPATGLFGLRIMQASLLLRSIEIRQALSMALDRDAIGEALGVPGWRSSQSILPPGITDLPQPTRPLWAQAFGNVGRTGDPAVGTRRGVARAIVQKWMQQNRQATPPVLRIAIADSPGGRILLRQIAAQWRTIGIAAQSAADPDEADLRLIDELAPIDQADWFLSHFTCDRTPICSAPADTALAAALDAIDPAERTRRLAESEQRLASLTPFIPIAQPVRWSLVAPGLPGFQANARAIHPLAALIVK